MSTREEKLREYRVAHREKANMTTKAWYTAHWEEALEYHRKRRQARHS